MRRITSAPHPLIQFSHMQSHEVGIAESMERNAVAADVLVDAGARDTNVDSSLFRSQPRFQRATDDLPDFPQRRRGRCVVHGAVAFALADTGRVWLEGEDSSRWHGGVGGGLWFAYFRRKNAVTLAVARSAEATSFYVAMGFPF